MRGIERLLERERGNWSIDATRRLGRGANAVVYRAEITAPVTLKAELQNEGLPDDLVLRLPDTPTPQDADKATNQFDQYSIAWVKLRDAGSPAIGHFMEPIFSERGITPPGVRLTSAGGLALPRAITKRGDAVFSYREGESVWNLWKQGNLPAFPQWRGQLHTLLEQVCSNETHYRDWHSENVLLIRDDDSWNVSIIDPGALILKDNVLWFSRRTLGMANIIVPMYRFNKYEIGVSVMGIQDLIWTAVNMVDVAFYDELKEILTHPDRQIFFPRILDK